MNHSYKLFGIYLDKTALPACIPSIIDLSLTEEVQDISVPYNLWDLISRQRKVSGCTLLSAESYHDISALIDPLDWCEQIIIILDFVSAAAAINMLYMKRLLQLLRILSEEYPNIEFTLSCSNEHAEFFTALTRSVYSTVAHQQHCII